MRDQLRQYQDRMKFTDDDICGFLGVKREAFRSYKRPIDATSPPFDKLVGYADRMMVSLDWLAGRPEPMWYAPAFAPYAEELHKALEENPPDTIVSKERWCYVIRLIHYINPEQFNSLFLSGLFRVSQDLITHIINGEFPTLPDKIESVFMEQFGLQYNWVHAGTGPIS